MKKLLITGGAGFIGSHMVDLLLEKNFKVLILDNLSTGHEKNISHLKKNPNLDVKFADCCNINNKDKFFKGIDGVFHFAGIGDIVPSLDEPSKYMKNNIEGTVNMLEVARFNNASKFVYSASSSCYGLAKTPTNETHMIDPQYPYALSKYLGERAVFHWNKVYKLPINSIRIFNAYGLRVRTTGAYGAVFGVFLKQRLSKKSLTVVGSGEQKRDFLYVTDVAEAFYRAYQTKLTGQIWNLGAGNPQSINYLVKLIGGEVVYIPKRPGEPDCTWADITKITKDLEWKPKVSFEDGVELMIKNINNWSDAPLWNKKNINEATKNWFKYLG
ncbi:MAG: NAD-dependent dehydratase [Rickettsiales bacterium]|nr:NAD-dependent dehydratase [Rickettsiales bacterium]|tara:strand:- start:10557 stop:11540 length:984 start_codon:yes stop_codon:yes gene_type:complete